MFGGVGVTPDPLLSADRERELDDAIYAAAALFIAYAPEANVGDIRRALEAVRAAALSSPEATPAGVLDEGALNALRWLNIAKERLATIVHENADVPAVRAARYAIGDIDTALRQLSSQPDSGAIDAGSGTTTDCPLEGVHEHPFRGPHRFHEWDPAGYFTLNDRPPPVVATPDSGAIAAERLAEAIWANGTVYPRGQFFREQVKDIAAEYNRLAPETTPAPDAGLRAAARTVVAEWDALMHVAIEDGEQGVLFPADTVNLADAILPLRAALSSPETTPAGVLDEAAAFGERVAAAHLYALANGWFDDVTVDLMDEAGMTPEDRWRVYSQENANRIVEADRALRAAALGRSGSGGGRG